MSNLSDLLLLLQSANSSLVGPPAVPEAVWTSPTSAPLNVEPALLVHDPASPPDLTSPSAPRVACPDWEDLDRRVRMLEAGVDLAPKLGSSHTSVPEVLGMLFPITSVLLIVLVRFYLFRGRYKYTLVRALNASVGLYFNNPASKRNVIIFCKLSTNTLCCAKTIVFVDTSLIRKKSNI